MEHKMTSRDSRGRIELRSEHEWEQRPEPPTALAVLPRELLLPYPPWVTYFFRGTLAIYETAALAFTVWVFTKWQEYEPDLGRGFLFPRDRYAIPLIVIVAALLGNLSAVVAIIMDRYHVAGLWRWMVFVDAAVGALGLYGSITMSGISHNDPWEKDLEVPWLGSHNAATALLFTLG